ncbi:SDR family oxidoreductase [Inconstantimicrobium mannanitabidum]|uniref:3-beta hydroxysteroid dehydrogenase n=1 Tax=Inconstantimicrobium mannanitabidum TaxID=1604901 RepID=A0ACB5RDU2_9CLOT|nr:SDR family oxidoreductase [Clostridium sp. TW13]GKX67440.1 3-beta hydroxysteroid dehydrogenase [Clostridium sp. TW13]
MKVLLGGCFGNLGKEILDQLILSGNKIVAVNRSIKENIKNENVEVKKCDFTKPEDLKDICEGVDCVISTVGLTTASKVTTHYDVDLQGNLNLLNEAKKSGVKKFIYISVIKCDDDPSIPMLDAKHKFEEKLIESGLDYTIYRPTGYFYDIAKVFKPMVDKGTVMLLKGSMATANVIDTKDLANCVVKNIDDYSKEILEIGGKEVYSYEEIAKLFFKAAKKEEKIKYVSPKLFGLLEFISRISKNGKTANIKFGRWTLSNDMTAKIKYGQSSFKEYINSLY